MGMNYYVISKNSNETAKKIFNTYEELYNTDKLNEIVKDMLMKTFEPTLDLVKSIPEYAHKTEYFEDQLDDAIRQFVSDIKYCVLDEFDIEERKSVHIGKSSWGWLFNFQIQDTDIDGVHLEWHNYNQVKDWLNKYVKEQKLFLIKDECDRELSVDELFDLIDTKQADQNNLQNPDNFSFCMNVDGYRFSSGDFS